MTWLPACTPVESCLGIFCCLLVLHFVSCFVSLGLLLLSRFHTWQPVKQPAQFQANMSAGVDLGTV